MPVPVTALMPWYQAAATGAELVVVEGAGGWRVPLHPEGFLSDLPEQLGLGVVLVVGLRLGCLNHARLTLEAIERSGRCRFFGWIGCQVDPAFARLAANLDTLGRLLGQPALAVVPHLPEPEPGPTALHLVTPALLRALADLA
jgi:dethiobiotin synthetase